MLPGNKGLISQLWSAFYIGIVSIWRLYYRSNDASKTIPALFRCRENFDGLSISLVEFYHRYRRVAAKQNRARTLIRNKTTRQHCARCYSRPSQDPLDLWDTCSKSRSPWFMEHFNSGRARVRASTFTRVLDLSRLSSNKTHFCYEISQNILHRVYIYFRNYIYTRRNAST